MSASKTRVLFCFVFFVINCETHIVPKVYEADHPFALLSMDKYVECIENVHCTTGLRPDCARCFWCMIAHVKVTSTDPFFNG